MSDITDPVSSLQTPFMEGLNNFQPPQAGPAPSYDPEIGGWHAAFQDIENNGGKTPDAVLASKVDENPQDFRDLSMNMNGLAYMTAKPIGDIALNYEQEKQDFVKRQGWDMPKTEAQFRGMLGGHVESVYNRHEAVNELFSSTVMKALEDTDYGNHRGIADFPTDLTSVWQQKHAPLIPDQKERDAYDKQSRSIYLKTLKDVAPIRKEIATSLKVLNDFTTGKASEQDIQTLGSMFKDMPADKMDKILSYVSVASQREHLDKKQTKGFLQNLGESISRGADFVGESFSQSDLLAMDRISKDIEAGKPIYLMGVNGEDTKNIKWSNVEKPNAALTAMYGDVMNQQATPEQVAALKGQIENHIKSAKVAAKLKQFAQSAIDPIKPMSGAGTWARTFEQMVYDVGSSIAPMGAVAINPVLGFEAYKTMHFNDLLIKNPDKDLQKLDFIAGVEGALEAVGDMLQIRVLKGVMPKIIDNYVKKFGNSAVRAVLRTAEAVGFEYAIETAQDAIPALVEGAANAMGDDIEQTSTWEDFQVFDSRRFWAIALLGGIGSGVATFRDLKDPTRQLNRTIMGYNGVFGAQAEHVLAAESAEEADARWQEVYSARSPEDIAKGTELLIKDASKTPAKPKQADTYAPVKNAAGETEWVVSDPAGKELGRFSEEESARGLISDRIAAADMSEQNAVNDLMDWWQQQDPTNTATIEAPRTVQQELDRMNEAGDAAGIANLHERIAFAVESGDIEPDADLNKVNILGGAKIETIAEGVFRGVISLSENAKPEDAFEEINHVFVKKALAEGRVTMPQLQSWLEQTEAATGNKYARETETDVMENIAKIGMDYAAGRIDESALPQSFVDYVKKLLLAFKEAMLRAIKLKEAFSTGKIDQDFESFLAESVGLDPQIMFDRESDRVAGEISGTSYSIKQQEDSEPKTLPDGTVINPDESTEQGAKAPETPLEDLDPSKQTPEEGWEPIKWSDDTSYSIKYLPTAYADMNQQIFDEIAKRTDKVYGVWIDRMRVGDYKGIPLQGGMYYPTIVENLKAGVVWAYNAEGVANGELTKASTTGGYMKLMLMQEGNVIGNKTFATCWFHDLQENIDAGKLTKKTALAELNRVRELFATHNNSKIRTGHTTKWKTIEEAKQQIIDMPQQKRGSTYFVKSQRDLAGGISKIGYGQMLTKALSRKGFPDAEQIVGDIEEPSFKGIPTGAISGIIKLDANQSPMTAAEAGVPEHMSYGYVLKGTPVARMKNFRNVKELFPEIPDYPLNWSTTPMDVSRGLSTSFSIRALDSQHQRAVEEGREGDAKDLVDAAARASANGRTVVGPLFHHGSFDKDVNGIPAMENGMHFGTATAALERAYSKPEEDETKSIEVEKDEETGRWHWKSASLDSYEMNEEGFSSKKAARNNAIKEIRQQHSEGFWDLDHTDLGTMTKAYLFANKFKTVPDQHNDWAAAIAQAKEEGFDGLHYINQYEQKGSSSYVVFEPTQIKSGDYDVRDSEGKLIPLSERFNPSTGDIRYSIRSQENIDSVTEAMKNSKMFPEGNLATYEIAKQRFGSVLERNRDVLLGLEFRKESNESRVSWNEFNQIEELNAQEGKEIEKANRSNTPEVAQKIEREIRAKYDAKREAVAQQTEIKTSRINSEFSSRLRREKLNQALIELDGILKNLPYEVRGRVGGMSVLANIGTGDKALADFFKKRVEMLDKELERYLSKEYDEATYKFLQTTLPKKREAGEKPKGIGADIQAMFSVVRESREWNAEEVNRHLAGIDSSLDNDELTPQQEARLVREAALVSAVGDWKNKTSTQKGFALKQLITTWSRGYQQFLTQKLVEKQERDADRADAIANTGKDGLLAERQRENIKQNGRLGILKKSYFNLTSWDQFVSVLFGENSETATFLANGERNASNTKEDRTQAKLDEVADLFTRLAGNRLKGEQLRWEMSQKSIAPFTGTPWTGLEFSQLEALSVTMLWMQEDGRRHMTGKLDDAGRPISAWHYNQEFVDMLEDSLSPEAKEVRAFLLDKYASGYHDINKVYTELNGISLPQIANYSPVTVAPINAPKGMSNDPVTGAVVSGMSSSPSALRTRGTSISEPNFRDVLQTYLAHTRQMEHWMAYAPFMHQANGTLRNRDVQNAIEAKGGEEARRMLNLHLDIMDKGGVREAAAQLGLNQTLSKIGGRAAQVALVGRISTILLQSTQLGASLAEMPTGAYILRMSKLLSGNLGWGEALKSPYIQRRLNEMPPIVRQAMEGLQSDRPNVVKHTVEKLGRLISGADALFTAGTYAITYDYHLKQAKQMGIPSPEAYAKSVAERAVDRLAQPTRMGARSIFENTQTGPFARIGWAFASESRKNLALAAYNTMEKPAGTKARTLFSLLILNALAGTLLRNAWKDAKDDDDNDLFDEKHWSPKRLALAAMTDPLQGFPIIGDAVKAATYKVAGEYLPSDNLFSMNSAAGVFSEKHLKNVGALLDGRGDWEMAIKDMDHLASGMGMLNGNIAAASSLTHLAADMFGLTKNTVKAAK